jgi:hypothetical protein
MVKWHQFQIQLVSVWTLPPSSWELPQSLEAQAQYSQLGTQAKLLVARTLEWHHPQAIQVLQLAVWIPLPCFFTFSLSRPLAFFL